MNLNFLVNNTFANDIAIDLGTDMTYVYIREKGIVVKEPSYIAYDTNTHEVQSCGTDARNMLGKNPPSITVSSPVVNGVVSDHTLASLMLKNFISKSCPKTLLKPRVIVTVPSDSTEVEKRALSLALQESGARQVFFMETPVAAAVGAGCDISLARGMLIANLGGGRCDVCSISLGHSVIKKSITTAGRAFCSEIIKYLKKKYNLNIGELSADIIKRELGCACSFDRTKTLSVTGCDVTSGLPRAISINSEEIKDVLSPLVLQIASVIRTTLEETPPELQSDILEDGILITGTDASLYGLDKFLKAELNIKVFIAHNPDECAAKGAGEELSKLDIANAEEKYCFTMYEI